MNQVLSIAFDVCGNGIRKSLKDMFAGAASVIREAAQNAERAGATSFSITHDENKHTLILENNGSVMKELDWKRLFHAGKSGWGDDVVESQNPFGIGSTSMLFCTSKIIVKSGYATAEINSVDFFNGSNIEINTSNTEYYDGTSFTLHVNESAWSDLALEKAESVFRGFPIEVIINDTAVDRTHAKGRSSFYEHEFPYGMLCINRDLRDVHFTFGSNPLTYLQGLPVSFKDSKSRVSAGEVSVHLDAKKVRASSPDRTRLVDPPSDLDETIRSAFLAAIRAIIEEDISARGYFVALCDTYSLAIDACEDLFNHEDAPLLESSFFTLDSPLEEIEIDSEYFNSLVSYSGIPGQYRSSKTFGTGHLVYHGGHEVNPVHAFEGQLFNFAYMAGLEILHSRDVPNAHHIYSQAINVDLESDFIVKGEGCSEPVLIHHECCTFHVVFHSGLLITPPVLQTADGKEVQWESLALNNEQSFYANSTYYVGMKDNGAGELAKQLSSFDKFSDADWYERDEEAEAQSVDELNRVLSVLRGDSCAAALTNMFAAHRYELNSMSEQLKGKQFVATLDDDGILVFDEIEHS